MAQRRRYYILGVFCLIAIFLIFHGGRNFRHSVSSRSAENPNALPLHQNPDNSLILGDVPLTGHAIAPKLANETAKAELGRATWKFFHTVMARFPEHPTPEESSTLKTFIHSFQRVYPCGECAEHFGELLKKFPPQVSGRQAAAGWACHVHNEVNKSLGKEVFDCNDIGDFYDCGCGDDEGKEGKGKKAETEEEGRGAARTTEIRGLKEKPEMSEESKEKLQTLGRDFNEDLLATD